MDGPGHGLTGSASPAANKACIQTRGRHAGNRWPFSRRHLQALLRPRAVAGFEAIVSDVTDPAGSAKHFDVVLAINKLGVR